MKILNLFFFLSIARLLLADTATVMVSIGINEIQAISVSGASPMLSPSNPSSMTSTYAITTNMTSQRITAVLGTPLAGTMPLTASMGAPTGATSLGSVSLSTTEATLVTNISPIAQSNLSLSYYDNFQPLAAPGTTMTTVTFTLKHE